MRRIIATLLAAAMLSAGMLVSAPAQAATPAATSGWVCSTGTDAEFALWHGKPLGVAWVNGCTVYAQTYIPAKLACSRHVSKQFTSTGRSVRVTFSRTGPFFCRRGPATTPWLPYKVKVG